MGPWRATRRRRSMSCYANSPPTLDKDVRLKLAGNPRRPADLLHQLATDAESFVR